MEDQELLSDTCDSSESPIASHAFDTYESPKLLKARRWQDLPWLIITLALYYILISIHLPIESPDMTQFNGIVMKSCAITIAIGGVWFYLMLHYAKILLILSIGTLPFILTTTAVIVGSLTNPIIDATLIIVGLFIISIGFIAIIIAKRDSLALTIQLLEFSCEIIKNNPGIWILSSSIMILHAIFSSWWIAKFGAIIQNGYQDHGNGVLVYFIFIYFFTSSIQANIEKVVISGVVGDWYFDKSHKSVRKHLKYALTTSFGSVCLASLIMGILATVKFSMKVFQRIASHSKLGILTCTVSTFLRILEDWTPYSLIMVGISGDDLWTSACKCTQLFRKNLVLGILSSSISRILVFSGSFAISCCSGVATGYILSDSMHNNTAILMGGLAAVIPFYILRGFGQILIHTMDSTFICYLLDLESNTCHCSLAHRLFVQS